MTKLPFQFAMALLGALGIALIAHIGVLNLTEQPLWDNQIILSYGLNFVLAVVIFLALYHFRNKLSNAIGFLFMGGSMLKFAVFFLVFYPIYKADGDMQRAEFAAFFVPYLIALLLETYFASKMLRKMEQKSKQDSR